MVVAIHSVGHRLVIENTPTEPPITRTNQVHCCPRPSSDVLLTRENPSQPRSTATNPKRRVIRQGVAGLFPVIPKRVYVPPRSLDRQTNKDALTAHLEH